MAINFLVGSTDLDNYFDPYVSGTKTCPAGNYVGSQDIRDRYAPLSVGSKAANTGFMIGGTDISNYFAGIGTASYWNGQLEMDLAYTSTKSEDGNPFINRLSFLPNGVIATPGPTNNGSWSTSPVDPLGSEVMFTYTQTGRPISITTNAATFQTIDVTRYVEMEVDALHGSSTYVLITVHLRPTGDPSSEISITTEVTLEIYL